MRMPVRKIFLSMAVIASLSELAMAQTSPSTAVEELLSADRSFAAASAKTDLISGISAMFADNVVMPIPRNGFAESKAAAIEVLRANPDNAKSRATWAPIRGGISADGQHGFTYGYMTTEIPGKASVPGKYLAYWVKGSAGWRVAVYKRAPRPEGVVSTSMRPPSLPTAMVEPSTDTGAIAGFRKSVDSVERAFSNQAQKLGLGAAFVNHGAPDAMNMGAEASFTFGPEAIGKGVSEGEPATGSSLSWAPDKVIVASSGDFGVTIGNIWPNDPPPAGQTSPRYPFFTIWRRASVNSPWRYVAE